MSAIASLQSALEHLSGYPCVMSRLTDGQLALALFVGTAPGGKLHLAIQDLLALHGVVADHIWSDASLVLFNLHRIVRTTH